MKNEILNYFKNDRTYNAGVALYIKYGKKESFKRKLNSLPESAHFFGLLLEELRQVADISNIDFQNIITMPVKLMPKAVEKIIEKAPEPEATKLTEVPEYVKKTIRLREEFPFLKEVTCPKELKILVADMITAYEKYREAHVALFDAATHEEIATICGEILDNYIENRDIWAELTYYKEKGKVLGKHTIFELQDKIKQLKKMKPADLAKRMNTLEQNIRRDKLTISENKKPELLTKRQDSLLLKEQELVEVKRLLEA
jgi:hypothetical protein